MCALYIASYFDHPLYIEGLVKQLKKYCSIATKNSYLLFSFHGLPQRCVELGDPYQQQCVTTVRLIAERLQLAADDYLKSSFNPVSVPLSGCNCIAMWYCNNYRHAASKRLP